MTKFQIIFFVAAFSLLVAGCTNENSTQPNSKQIVPYTNISTTKAFDQNYSNEAKELLSKKDNIEKVTAANTDDLLIIAIEIPHRERFKLSKINKKLSKEMDEYFKQKQPDLTVELVTDKKIFWELEKLEEKLKKNNISKKELKKQLKHISKLLKEQT